MAVKPVDYVLLNYISTLKSVIIIDFMGFSYISAGLI